MTNSQRTGGERKFAVRFAKQTDLPRVIEIDAQNTGMTRSAYWESIFDRYGNKAHDTEESVRQNSVGQDRIFLVAGDGDTVLGFVIGEVRAWEFGQAPCGWVLAIGVRRDIRQGGIGHALFDAIADRFRKAGIAKVRTMLARDDIPAMSFFRSQGMMAAPFIQLEKDL